MTRMTRLSKRQRKKAQRKEKRKQARKNGDGRKAGSIAIHSRLPGLEGTAIGSMDVVVDARRKDVHPSEISVAIHQRAAKRAVIWTIETGFGGQMPRVGFQVIPDGSLGDAGGQPPPTCWFADIDDIDVASLIDGDCDEDVSSDAESMTDGSAPP